MKLLFAAMSLVCVLGFSRLQVSSAAEENVASAPDLSEEISRPSEVEGAEALAICPAYYTCWRTGQVYSNHLSCSRDCAPSGCLIDHHCNGTCVCP